MLIVESFSRFVAFIYSDGRQGSLFARTTSAIAHRNGCAGSRSHHNFVRSIRHCLGRYNVGFSTDRDAFAHSICDNWHLVSTSTHGSSWNILHVSSILEVFVGDIVQHVALESVFDGVVLPCEPLAVRMIGSREVCFSVIDMCRSSGIGHVDVTNIGIGCEGVSPRRCGAAQDSIGVAVPKVAHERSIGKFAIGSVPLQRFVVWPTDASGSCHVGFEG
mmetsp:Transcript_24421/g.41500  ORF Transcript_24421/g.41500 Transcript_24421/m.41500 type:complete len:218 (+) Transcript_24421:725-1378(+)